MRTLHAIGALEVLLNELKKYRWDVMGISETHWTGMDDFRRDGFRIISSGQENAHRSGVALILGPLAQSAFLGSNPVSDRILTARFQALTGCVTICQVYAPTTEASDTDIDAFYGELQIVISSIPRRDMIIVMGDFNAKVGQQLSGENGLIGRFAYGRRNERGERLVNFCGINDLCITNSLFKQAKENRCWTWESPNGRDRNQIDYILVSRRMKGWVRNSRAYPSADTGSDHQLVMANLKLKLKRNPPQKGIAKTDILKLKDPQICQEYKNAIERRWKSILEQPTTSEPDRVEVDWIQMRSSMQETASQIL